MDPMTMAMVASKGISVIGSILGGIGGFQAGRAKAKALKQAAAQSRLEAGVRGSLELAEGDRAAARAATLAAAGGGGVTGSALSVLDDLAGQAMFNARTAAYEGEAEARNREYEARVAKRQGQIDLLTGVTQAGATTLSAFGDYRASRRNAAMMSGHSKTQGRR